MAPAPVGAQRIYHTAAAAAAAPAAAPAAAAKTLTCYLLFRYFGSIVFYLFVKARSAVSQYCIIYYTYSRKIELLCTNSAPPPRLNSPDLHARALGHVVRDFRVWLVRQLCVGEGGGRRGGEGGTRGTGKVAKERGTVLGFVQTGSGITDKRQYTNIEKNKQKKQQQQQNVDGTARS